MTEEKKVPIHRHRVHALLRCMIHLIPAGAAIGLLSLNAAEYYVGGELAGQPGQDDQKLGALQFAAKLHEILMLASIAAIVFGYIRKELLFGEGIPYGAVSAGLKLDSLRLLYSPELWGVFWARWENKHKKWCLSSLLIFSVLLGTTVGPSTANLMRPRLGDWPAGGTTFTVNASELLSPRTFDSSQALAHCWEDTGDRACPHGDWEVINKNYHAYWPNLRPLGSMPDVMDVPGRFSAREMLLRHRSTHYLSSDGIRTSSIWQNAFTTATTQHSVVADGLAEVGRLWAFAATHGDRGQRFRFRRDATYSAIAPQPIAQARCEEYVLRDNTVNGLRFPVPVDATCNGDSSSCTLDTVDLLVNNNATLVNQVRGALLSNQPPNLIWVEAWEHSEALKSSINAIATFPETAAHNATYYCCNIYSAIGNATITTTRSSPKYVKGYPSGILGIPVYEYDARNWAKIKVTPAWARLLNPSLSGENATVFSRTASTAGMWNSELTSFSYNFPFIIESILATMVANGLARTTYNSTIVGTLKGADPRNPWRGGAWVNEMLPRRQFGWDGSIYDVDTDSAATSSMFVMRATVTGYAWSSRGKLQKAALTVIFLYVGFALAHVTYSAWTGWTSTSWETAPEILALAMNSQATERLHNTGAGIDTVSPFQEKVKVRYRHGHLEFVFQDNNIDGSSVRPNQEYA
jgi:hypothetical protein